MITDTLAGWGGWVIGIATILFTYIRERRKHDVDESTLILGKWKELVEQHQADIRVLKDEFATYKLTAITEIADLRLRLVHAEKRIGELEQENAGLKRAIVQNSKSAAYQFGRSRDRASKSDDRQDVNDLRVHGMEDEINRLDQAGDNSSGASE